jgi:hypothetical protein
VDTYAMVSMEEAAFEIARQINLYLWGSGSLTKESSSSSQRETATVTSLIAKGDNLYLSFHHTIYQQPVRLKKSIPRWLSPQQRWIRQHLTAGWMQPWFPWGPVTFYFFSYFKTQPNLFLAPGWWVLASSFCVGGQLT